MADLPKLSVRDAFRGSCVLLTGVTGFVGSLVMEQLLRVCPDVDRVYVLIRSKKSMSAAERLTRLVNSGLFNQLWKKPEALERVCLVEGDVTVEGLGLETKDAQEICGNVEYVIHSAAAVALDDPIKKTLMNNYVSTQNVLKLCKAIGRLRAYVHISTAYVNITFPWGSTVKEKIYPLRYGDKIVSHEEIASELLRLPKEAAEGRASMLMRRWNFPCTYCLGKHLAEQMVAGYHMKPFPVCIVRPSLVTGLAGPPYPGYVGNLAGGAGFTIAFAVGFFEKDSGAWKPESVVDGVPGDTVSSVVLAAAAFTATQPLKKEEPAIFHACTSTTYPLTNFEMYSAARSFFNHEPPPYCLQWSYPELPKDYSPSPHRIWFAKSITWLKVCALSYFLRLLGKRHAARRLYIGWRAWNYANQSRYDMNLFFSTDNVQAMHAMLVDDERSVIRCLWRPQCGDWQRFMRTAMAGVKSLFLKSPVAAEDHDFQRIPPKDPPICISTDFTTSSPKEIEEKEPNSRTTDDEVSSKMRVQKLPMAAPGSMAYSEKPSLRRSLTNVEESKSPFQQFRTVRRTMTGYTHDTGSASFRRRNAGTPIPIQRVSSRAMSEMAASLWSEDDNLLDDTLESTSETESSDGYDPESSQEEKKQI